MAKVIIIILIVFNILIFTNVQVFSAPSAPTQSFAGQPKPKYNWLGKPSGFKMEQETKFAAAFLEKMRAKPRNEKIRILLLSLTICNVLLIIKYLRNPKIK